MRSLTLVVTWFLVMPLMSGCVTGDSTLMASGYPKWEEDFFRIESCVHGGMPEEIQFVKEGSPPSLAHKSTIDADSIEAIAEALDMQVAGLLADAAKQAWEMTNDDHGHGDMSILLANFHDAVVAIGPQRLTLTFCGEQDRVGLSIATSIMEWFIRALRPTEQHDEMKLWLASLGPRGEWHGAAFLELVVSMRLAGIDHPLEELLHDYERFASMTDSGVTGH